MDAKAKQAFIQLKALKNQGDPEGNRILWSRHAIAELVGDELDRIQVEEALKASEVIEDYALLHRPPPDCLVLGWLPDEEPVHAVIAIDKAKDRLFVITVYKPSPEEWENDWRTRKE
jgi:hypothetical protein